MADATGIDDARRILLDAIQQHFFPAATVQVGSSRAVLWQEPLGTLSFDLDAPATRDNTWFDLASLTKPLATTTIVLDLAARGVVSLDEPIARSFPAWRGDDRIDVTIADLLEHASGLPARFLTGTPLPSAADDFAHAICTTPLAYPTRTQSIYSDLGFILLGLLAADLDGNPLDVMFARQVQKVAAFAAAPREDARSIGYLVPEGVRPLTAPTRPLPEDTRGVPVLVADVHDNYAAALGGIAGHAGLFGTSAAVGAFARAVLRAARGIPELDGAFSVALTRRATMASTVPGSSRALGWDRMRPTSSCGERMSPTAFGHVGFTGTSLWIDPTRDRYYVLLSNRVCGNGSIDEMRTVRRAFHDALAEL